MRLFVSLLIMSVVFTLTPLGVKAEGVSPLEMDVRTRISIRAAQQAVDKMQGVYSWEEYRSCSSFASGYLRELSFPVDGLGGEYSEHPDPFPWSGVIKQVEWIRRNAPNQVQDAPLIDLLQGKLWDKIEPGSLIYVQSAVGHNGYDSYYHVVILVGYRTDGSPVFAEISSGRSASWERGFEETFGFYRGKNGGWEVTPYEQKTKYLLVTWFDPLAYLPNLWLKPGKVQPSKGLIASHYDVLVTVNLTDGTTGVFDKTPKKEWKAVSIGGKDVFFAVTGRLLPANNEIGGFFEEKMTGVYDSDLGVYISDGGVYQHSWSPQLITSLTGFANISGFGGLDGSTDTAILTPYQSNTAGVLGETPYHSSFTIHRVPDVVNQDMLLRVDLLKRANRLGKPISVPGGNLSSGCINYDGETWALLKGYIQERLGRGERIGVVFSYPQFDQNLILSSDLFKNPFVGTNFYRWCPEQRCDALDRRNYRKNYLGY